MTTSMEGGMQPSAMALEGAGSPAIKEEAPKHVPAAAGAIAALL